MPVGILHVPDAKLELQRHPAQAARPDHSHVGQQRLLRRKPFALVGAALGRRLRHRREARLLEVGAWLKDHGRAIYGTRGGPWKWAAWGGSTRRDKTVWLHVAKREGDTLRLPALPGRTVVSAQLLTGEKVACKQAGGILAVTVPKASQAAPDTIVQLTFDKAVDDLPALAGGEVSLFHDTVTYGRIVSRHAKVKTSSTSKYDPPAGSAGAWWPKSRLPTSLSPPPRR